MSSEMGESSVSSLSKACFIHREKEPRKRKFETLSSNLIKRKNQYSQLWKNVESKIKEIELVAHHEVITSVAEFVKKSSSSESIIQRNIPTVALIMGVNVPDHASLFHMLSENICKSVTPHVVTLASKNCTSLTGMIQNTVSTIIHNYIQDQGKEFPLKRHDCTFSTLLMWYKEVEECPSPKKRVKKAHAESGTTLFESTPIVILLEDLEAFAPRVLQNFILICSNYVGRLPLVLVFGVATTVTAVHNLLPQKASSCLAMETFCMPPATEYLTQVLHKVVMSPSLPFKLGPRVFRLLVDVVLFHDFSIANLTRMLKFCIMEHFYSKPAAVLCCATSDLAKQLQAISYELEAIKELPSFSKFMATLNPKEKQTIFTNASYCKSVLKELLEKLHQYHKKMSVLVECLHILVKDLPGHPLGKQSREIYLLTLEKTITETEEYQKAFKMLRMLSCDELKTRMDSSIAFLQNNNIMGEDVNVVDKMKKLVESLQKSCDEELDEDCEKHTAAPVNFGKMTSRAQLKEKLESLAQQKKLTKFERCRQELVDYLETLFSELIPPSTFPLHEVLYFDSPITLKKHFMPVPRAALHKALMFPHSYLKCDCCEPEDENEQTLGAMLDICVVYHLYLECGKLINLYDWLQAFKAVKGGSKEIRGRIKKTKKPEEDSLLQARFFQAVSELQFLGFIKATSRKTDHVTRLTWGTC